MKITFNHKTFDVQIKVNRDTDGDGYHYDMELQTKDKITGEEFQKLRKYLEDEGYLDDAVEKYKKNKKQR